MACTAVEGVGELYIAAESGGKSCIYLLMSLDSLTIDMLFKGLTLCDLRKIIGSPQNFIADGEGRVGFLVRFPDNAPDRRQLVGAFQQILQSHARLMEK